MSDFARYLAAAMNRQGVSQTDLAGAIGMSQSAVSKFVRGVYVPDGGVRRRIADRLGIDFDEFEEGWGAPSLRRGHPQLGGIPVVNKTAAGYGANYDTDHYDEYATAWEYVDRGDIDDSLAFAVRVVEDSMEPELVEGDVLVLRPFLPDDAGSPSLEPGDLVLVRLSGDADLPGQATIAKWYPQANGRVLLTKTNPRVPPLLVRAEHVERVAVAVERRRRMK